MPETPIQLLIVEDDAAHAEAIRRSFQHAAVSIQVLGSLQQYRDYISTKSPDLVLVDLHLPDGLALEILCSPPEACGFPVLVMTSFGNEQIAVEAIKAGALDYVVKSAESFAAMPHILERALREWNLLMERKRVVRALEDSVRHIRKLLDGTVTAIASAMELRDPYTAGHQKRVAKLACAIAQEVELDKAEIDTVRMAALLHDIGKIYVPSEILSKPTKLAKVEFAIIKVHPEAGYEILKPVEFSGPVAEIIYQHHEKLDGSGYPQGLTGESILTGARIIAVADVVEAMASHRPYRAALGIASALVEIERGMGTVYDGRYVKACLKLFADKDFLLDE